MRMARLFYRGRFLSMISILLVGVSVQPGPLRSAELSGTPVEATVAAQSIPNSAGLETAIVLSNQATIERGRRHFELSASLLDKAYSIIQGIQNSQNPLPPVAGAILVNVGLSKQTHGKYEEARQLYERASILIEQSPGKQSEDYAKLLKDWALLDFEAGKTEEALSKDQKAVAIENSLSFVSGEDRALTFNNLGLALEAAGRTSEAESAFLQSITLRRKETTRPNVELAQTLDNLAALKRGSGRLEEARGHEIEALAIVESGEMEGDPIVATFWNNLGMIEFARNKMPEARKQFDKAAALWLKTVGPEHPSRAAALSNIASIDSKQGHHKAAQGLYEQALKINESWYGPSHPAVASNLCNIGAELFHQKHFDDSLGHYKRCEQIYREFSGERSLQTAQVRHNMAVVFVAAKRASEAQTSFRDAIQSLEAAAGPDAPMLSSWLHEYAMLLKTEQHFAEAEEAEVRALGIEVRNTIKANRSTTGTG